MNSLAYNETQRHSLKSKWRTKNKTVKAICGEYAARLTNLQAAAQLAYSRGNFEKVLPWADKFFGEKGCLIGHDSGATLISTKVNGRISEIE